MNIMCIRIQLYVPSTLKKFLYNEAKFKNNLL